MMKHKVVLMLGSNQGDRKEFLRKASELISEQIGNIYLASPVYETEAVGYESENHYLNQALLVQTGLSAEGVLEKTQDLERKLGRVRSETQRYADRTIDIDIIFYDDIVIETDRLVVPHPEIARREFVLRPLMDLIPQYKHPISGESVAEMHKKLKNISYL